MKLLVRKALKILNYYIFSIQTKQSRIALYSDIFEVQQNILIISKSPIKTEYH